MCWRPALAEVWLCRDLGAGRSTFTTTPVNSDQVQCVPDATARASFLKLPEEEFNRWGTAPVEETALNPPEASSPKNNHVQKTKDTGALSVRYTAHDINLSTKKASKRGLNTGCELQGVAKGERAGTATITITRGALTVDTVKVSIPEHKEQVQWSQTLKGPCRKPQVEIAAN